VLPTIRHGARPAPRRRPGAFDRVLGVSRRRRQAGYMALAAGLHLLRPMIRRLATATVLVVGLAALSAYLRFVF
jgi:hypothetical protein